MSAQHTPGPLTVRENGDANSYAMLTADHKWLAVNLLHNGEVMVQQQRENMRRLAICWNACEQMSTTSIEELVTLGGVPALIVYGDDLRRERNELLALAKEFEAFSEAAMRDAHDDGDAMTEETWRTRLEHARAAIARATGASNG